MDRKPATSSSSSSSVLLVGRVLTAPTTTMTAVHKSCTSARESCFACHYCYNIYCVSIVFGSYPGRLGTSWLLARVCSGRECCTDLGWSRVVRTRFIWCRRRRRDRGAGRVERPRTGPTRGGRTRVSR